MKYSETKQEMLDKMETPVRIGDITTYYISARRFWDDFVNTVGFYRTSLSGVIYEESYSNKHKAYIFITKD